VDGSRESWEFGYGISRSGAETGYPRVENGNEIGQVPSGIYPYDICQYLDRTETVCRAHPPIGTDHDPMDLYRLASIRPPTAYLGFRLIEQYSWLQNLDESTC
jgi:hypothetical protein